MVKVLWSGSSTRMLTFRFESANSDWKPKDDSSADVCDTSFIWLSSSSTEVVK